MQIRTVKVDRILNKIARKDDLFCGDYTADPYQNCDFGCIYCDSSYNNEVFVKINAAEILDKELEDIPKGRIIVGSVHDPYQKIEEQYKLTRKILRVIQKHDFACHILTKSDLVLRDIDLLKKMKDAIVTISITSADETVSKIFERNVSSPANRMNIVEKLKKSNIKAGVAVMPAIPFIIEDQIEKIVQESKEHNADYLIFKHLELKGDQKSVFFEVINEYFPTFYEKFVELYKDSFFPSGEYISHVGKKIKEISLRKGIENTIDF